MFNFKIKTKICLRIKAYFGSETDERYCNVKIMLCSVSCLWPHNNSLQKYLQGSIFFFKYEVTPQFNKLNLMHKPVFDF